MTDVQAGGGGGVATLPPRTGFDEVEDPFQIWCWERGIVLPEDQAKRFDQYILETTGWDTRGNRV